jgi:hypothetical protein
VELSQRANAPQRRLAKQVPVATPKESLSIPGAFPTSQESAPRFAHSVVSARKTDDRVPKSVPTALKPMTSSNRVKKSSRQPSSSHKKLSVTSPKAELPPNRPGISLRFSSFSSQSTEGPLKRGRTRGRPSHQQGAQPYRPELSPIEEPTKRLTPPQAARDDKTMNRSFSELLVTITQNNLTGPLQRRYTEASPDLSSDPGQDPKVPDPSVFSRPGKKREGYGFSYSESLFDSDEYPDTDSGLDPEEEEQTSPLAALLDPNRSFDDIVVMRDVGSFHLAKPQRKLPCTKATREDTIRLKARAKSLDKWDGSVDVSSALVRRLERMARSEVEKKLKNRETSIPSMVQCASKLKDFLERNVEDRVATGESRRAVKHEIEWATWLVDASRAGVMHLRTKDCTCRPDWEED